MKEKRIGIIMHGVTGRMGMNQHLIRSILEIRKQGGVALKDGTRLVPDPILIGRNADKLKELVARLNEAKLPYYTEPVATAQGQVTRVRVGPFEDRAAAEKAAERLKALGLKPGNVAARS